MMSLDKLQMIVSVTENLQKSPHALTQFVKDVIEQEGELSVLKKQCEAYRKALLLLNKVASEDMKDIQLTSSHFLLDATSDALEEADKISEEHKEEQNE